MPDPLVTVLRPGPSASGVAVAGSLARSLAPEESADVPPPWLLPEQRPSFRRVLAAIRRHNGAVLADPVGSGKTYVALAAATAVNRGPTACLVPATLLAQWSLTARSLGIPVSLCSHEQVSRGALPRGTRGLVIIDESHHFRNPATRRYENLAPWLMNRPALMVTATPVVNRAADLVHQLLLAVRDDALLADGVASLQALLATGCTTASLGQLVIEGEQAGIRRPATIHTTARPSRQECAVMRWIIQLLGHLRLSRTESIAALLRGVLLRSAGSSPAALLATLHRYRTLLLHAHDALRSGQVMDRSAIRRFTGELGDQLIWWELMPAAETGSDIDLRDLDEIDSLIHSVNHAADTGDPKLGRLDQLLRDGTPSLVFTTFRETVRYLRDHASDSSLAWCTGDCAGIGRTRLPRSAVLGWFRADVSSSLGPQHLVVTDVAAEGLDLQRAGRVVHYDLPWTPMRLDQREGRSVRYGSALRQIEVVRFAPPPDLECALGMERQLEQKGRLPAMVGLGAKGKHVWRWRADLALRVPCTDAVAGTALVASEANGLLAGFTLHRAGHSPRWLSSTVLWLEPDGTWTEAPEVLANRLEQAATARAIIAIDGGRLQGWIRLLARPIKERLMLVARRRWIIPEPSPLVRRVAARLQSFTRAAARTHRPDRLMNLEHALGFVTRGHTAGETALVERLADSSDAELERTLSTLPPGPTHWGGIEVRLSGLVLFGPTEHPRYAPC